MAVAMKLSDDLVEILAREAVDNTAILFKAIIKLCV